MKNINDWIGVWIDESIIFVKIHQPKNAENEFDKIEVERIKNSYRISKYKEKKVYHSMTNLDEVKTIIANESSHFFKQLFIRTNKKEYQVRFSKKGKMFVNINHLQISSEKIVLHNRQKKYILTKENGFEFLFELGIMDQTGHVKHAMYKKYRQLNRYLEFVNDAYNEFEKSDEIRIVDFGCGKSYLTFALYHYFVNIKKRKVNIVGLDLKQDVILSSNQLADKLGFSALKFEIGDIANYRSEEKVDMVVSLHACDTATDYAIYQALRWEAKVIFAVPCCQHEINKQVKKTGMHGAMKYGIIKERISALLTDSLRAELISACGYKVQILEFVETVHTPKNLLIRAYKKGMDEFKVPETYRALADELGFETTLYSLLKKGVF